MMKSTFSKYIVQTGVCMMLVFGLSQCSSTSSLPEWQQKNEELIRQHNLNKRELSGITEPAVESNLESGKVKGSDSLASVTVHPGITAKIFWGSGNMVSTLQLEPNAKIPEEVLMADRFVFVLEGSIEQLINGTMMNMIGKKREEPDGIHSATPRVDFVYLEKGTKNAVTAGETGAKLIEVYSPLRLDYLQKAGVKNLPSEIKDIESFQTPNVSANKVYDLYDIQLTPLATGAHSRLVSGKNTQLSFISMDPGSVFPHHIHPEEQMMFVLRGECSEIILDGEQAMKANSVVRIPGNMVHGAKIGELGCDALDIFWPARARLFRKTKSSIGRLSCHHTC